MSNDWPGPTISLDHIISPFAFKRRSNPSAAFSELLDYLLSAVEDDRAMKEAFGRFQRNLKGVGLAAPDAARLEELERSGAEKLGIGMNHYPLGLGPGLVLLYDATLQALQSGDRPIYPKAITAQRIGRLADSLETILPIIGSLSVSALEQALDDDSYRDHLRGQAAQLEVYLQPQPPGPGPCEHCELIVQDKQGNILDHRCGSQDECNLLGGILIIGLLVWLIYELLDWIF